MTSPRVVMIYAEDLLPQHGAGRHVNYVFMIQHPVIHPPVYHSVTAGGFNITNLVTLLLSLTTVVMPSNKGVPLLLAKDRISKGLQRRSHHGFRGGCLADHHS
jgi:hypothetical protein